MQTFTNEFMLWSIGKIPKSWCCMEVLHGSNKPLPLISIETCAQLKRMLQLFSLLKAAAITLKAKHYIAILHSPGRASWWGTSSGITANYLQRTNFKSIRPGNEQHWGPSSYGIPPAMLSSSCLDIENSMWTACCPSVGTGSNLVKLV